jgi:hypothetical protein
MIPDEKLGVVLLTNAENPSPLWRDVISLHIRDAVLGLSPWAPDAAAGCIFPCALRPQEPVCHRAAPAPTAPAVAPAAPSSRLAATPLTTNFTEYAGIYTHPAYGAFTVSTTPTGARALSLACPARVTAHAARLGAGLNLAYFAISVPLSQGVNDVFVGGGSTATFWRDATLRVRGALRCQRLRAAGVRQVVAVTFRYAQDAVYQITAVNSLYRSTDFPGSAFVGTDGLVYMPSPAQAGPQGPPGAPGPAGPGGSAAAAATALLAVAVVAAVVAVASALYSVRSVHRIVHSAPLTTSLMRGDSSE